MYYSLLVCFLKLNASRQKIEKKDREKKERENKRGEKKEEEKLFIRSAKVSRPSAQRERRANG